MLLTVCTIAQLPQALTLGASFTQHNPDRQFVIGLADDPDHLPANWSSPYRLLTLADAGCSASDVAALSARYTPTEFRTACKAAFIQVAYQQTEPSVLLYADPSAFVYHSLNEVFDQVARHSILLCPHWLQPPADNRLPDEKHLQNVGLYSSGLIGFGPHPDTSKMLTWWKSRTADRAHIDFCAGQCLDQLWLMHVPALFEQVGILKHVGLQVALWNVQERHLALGQAGWQVIQKATPVPLLTADFAGLLSSTEGLFQRQNRLNIAKRPDVSTLVSMYQTALKSRLLPELGAVRPAYGQQPEPVLLRGWRFSIVTKLHRLSTWISNVPVRPIHR
ncbi:hypothetical protein [Fibrella forsythiae]|uniref:Uncharacterized protein n=1 Tax=Fibrella forsythiae TaxID=2817061 RepID=A0ABS3JQX7_9BACT|nr:hypothetical protein [Fibrella forsythiae]MBO0952414.1 hypothetical protein [Fibrella forsythiae]